MLLVIVEDEAAMGQSEHAVRMGAHAGQQAGAAGRAGGAGVDPPPEQPAWVREPLQIRRWYGVSIRLEVTAGVVRVDVNDVGTRRGRLRKGGRRAGYRSEEMAARDRVL